MMSRCRHAEYPPKTAAILLTESKKYSYVNELHFRAGGAVDQLTFALRGGHNVYYPIVIYHDL